MRIRSISWLALAPLFLLPACSSYEFVRPPAREADLYPYGETHMGISVAVDQITDHGRVERYFGTDLLDKGVLPVQVIISNHTDHSISVKPSDVLLTKDRAVVDPIPVENVAAMVKDAGFIVTGGTKQRIDEFFAEIALKDTILGPGQHHQGMLFFEVIEQPNRFSRYFRVVSLFLEPELRVHMAVTDLESRGRVRFGPFGLYRDTSY